MKKIELGIDIGGSNVRIVCKDEFGRYHHINYPFVCGIDTRSEVEDNIIRPIFRYLDSSNKYSLNELGVSLAAFFDRDTGCIIDWPNNKKWKGFNLKEYLAYRMKCNVYFEDDANCGALGEYHAGSAKGVSDFIYVTVSTGIGSGIVLDHKLLKGTRGMAGNIGHICLESQEVLCACGQKGCLQAIASGKSILEIFNESEDTKVDSFRNIAELAKSGYEPAKEIITKTGVILGKVLANTVKLLDIPLIVLGGGVVEGYPYLTNKIQNTINASLKSFSQEVVVKKTILGDINCGIGALYINE